MVGIKKSWSFKLLKDYLANRKFEEDTPIYAVSSMVALLLPQTARAKTTD
jgi:hypothetical protein